MGALWHERNTLLGDLRESVVKKLRPKRFGHQPTAETSNHIDTGDRNLGERDSECHSDAREDQSVHPAVSPDNASGVRRNGLVLPRRNPDQNPAAMQVSL